MKFPRRYFFVGLAFVIGCSTSVGLYLKVKAWKAVRLQHEFIDHAEDRAAAFQKNVETSEAVLYSVAGLYAASRDVERSEFGAFAKGALAHQPEIYAIEWSPRVPDLSRSAFESSARSEGFSDFEIKEPAPGLKLVRASRRDEYYPLYFVEPFNGVNRSVFGLDRHSSSTRRKAMDRARDEARPIATEWTHLLRMSMSQSKSDTGFIVFLPVYKKDAPAETLDERRRNIQGFVSVVFGLREMTRMALRGMDTEEVELYFYDASADPADRMLYEYGPRAERIVDLPFDKAVAVARSGIYWSATVDVSGRSWVFLSRPAEKFLQTHRDRESRVILLAGLMMSALLANFLSSLLRRTEEEAHLRMASIVESSDDAIIGVGLDGKITAWNAGARRVFGYSSEDILGHPIAVFIPPERSEERDQILGKIIHGESIRNFETERVRKDGRKIHVSLTLSPVRDPVGEISGISVIARDITELKKLEEMKSDFLSMVSHELSTPISVVSGAADQLRMSAASLDERQNKYVNMISRNAERLGRLAMDFQEIARMEGGRFQIRTKPVRIQRAVESACSSLSQMAKDLQVKMSYPRPDDARDITLPADVDRIEQVVTNLTRNALRFATSLVEIRIESIDSECRIIVEDDGPGIDPDDVPRLFTKFYRGKQRGKIKDGSGLGLAIVRGIVEAHGGSVRAENRGIQAEGVRGARFTVALPLHSRS